jgi:hypothetical protein
MHDLQAQGYQLTILAANRKSASLLRVSGRTIRVFFMISLEFCFTVHLSPFRSALDWPYGNQSLSQPVYKPKHALAVRLWPESLCVDISCPQMWVIILSLLFTLAPEQCFTCNNPSRALEARVNLLDLAGSHIYILSCIGNNKSAVTTMIDDGDYIAHIVNAGRHCNEDWTI